MQRQQPIEFARTAFADTERGCAQIEKDDCGTGEGVYQQKIYTKIGSWLEDQCA